MANGDLYKHRRTGEPFSVKAELWNNMLDVVKSGQGGIDLTGVGPERTGLVNVEVFVVNNLGRTIKPFELVCFSNLSAPPDMTSNIAMDAFFNNSRIFNAEERAPKHWEGNYGVAKHEIEDGDAGRIVYKGIVAVPIWCSTGSERYDYVDIDMNTGTLETPQIEFEYFARRGTGRGRVLYMDTAPISPELIGRAEQTDYTGNFYWGVVDIGDPHRMNVRATLVGVERTLNIHGEGWIVPWRWTYQWSRALPSHDAYAFDSGNSYKYVDASVVPAAGVTAITNTVENFEGQAGYNDTFYALNRYESHLQDALGPLGGTQGYVGMDPCNLPSANGSNCPLPPSWAAFPNLTNVPKGVVVDMTASRSIMGHTQWSYEAMSPMQFENKAIEGPSPI